MSAPYTIFFSWQSDSPNSTNRRFIRDALDAAVSKLPTASNVEDCPRVDSAMENIAGTPEVASIMFDKISDSSIFVGDVTLVGRIRKKDEIKKVANPNVLLELGYAAGVLGWERVICVINETSGKREEQAFDVRNRRFPINYSLDVDSLNRKKVFEELTASLHGALLAVDRADLRKAEVAVRRLDQDCLSAVHTFGSADCFAERLLPKNECEEIYNDLIKRTVPRLLDLGLIYCHNNPDTKLYAYHWTYLGEKVVSMVKGK